MPLIFVLEGRREPIHGVADIKLIEVHANIMKDIKTRTWQAFNFASIYLMYPLQCATSSSFLLRHFFILLNLLFQLQNFNHLCLPSSKLQL